MHDKVALSDDMLENVWGGSQIPYIVQPGDTLGVLASKFHCTIDDLCRWNNLTDPNKIWENQILKVKF